LIPATAAVEYCRDPAFRISFALVESDLSRG
jgi:hypothetical protein